MLRVLLAFLCCLGGACWAQESAPDPVEKWKAQLARAERILKDWPNLHRYRADNEKVQPPQKGENRVVFMGDSITDGWGRRYGRFFPGKPYINRGISGQTTPQMLLRFRPDVIALHPKVVVILAGTNDIAGNTGPATLEEMEGNLQSMAELARANGIRVVLSSVMPVCDYIKPQTSRRPPEKIVQLNEWIRDYALQGTFVNVPYNHRRAAAALKARRRTVSAQKNHFVYLDYTSMLDDRKMLRQELTYDGLHPNDAGYEVMGPLAEKAIAAALKRK